jgi:hypothetical protein
MGKIRNHETITNIEGRDCSLGCVGNSVIITFQTLVKIII